MSFMRLPIGLSIIVFLSSGCSPLQDQEASPSDSHQSMAEISILGKTDEETGRAGHGPAVDSTRRADLTQSMPVAFRGHWRENDLSRDPTHEDCNQTSQSNRNFGKVLTINAEGYSLFEDGGRIIDVHGRSEHMIDATFDTTYADTPTRARKDFALRSDGSLAVNRDDEDGRPDVTEYLRCP